MLLLERSTLFQISALNVALIWAQIHWPVAFRKSNDTIQPLRPDGHVDVVDVPIEDTWTTLEKLVQKGKIRAIGVSNFTRANIERLMKT